MLLSLNNYGNHESLMIIPLPAIAVAHGCAKPWTGTMLNTYIHSSIFIWISVIKSYFRNSGDVIR